MTADSEPAITFGCCQAVGGETASSPLYSTYLFAARRLSAVPAVFFQTSLGLSKQRLLPPTERNGINDFFSSPPPPH